MNFMFMIYKCLNKNLLLKVFGEKPKAEMLRNGTAERC